MTEREAMFKDRKLTVCLVAARHTVAEEAEESMVTPVSSI